MRLTKLKLNDGDLVIIHYHYNLSSVASNMVNTLNGWASSKGIYVRIESHGYNGQDTDNLQVTIFSTKGIDQVFEEEVLR